MNLRVDVDVWAPGICLVSPVGDVDVYGATTLKNTCTDLSDQGFHTLLIDLNDVGDIDATGFGVLVGALKRALARGGSLELVCGRERLLRFLRRSGLIELFRVYGSRADARAYSGLV